MKSYDEICTDFYSSNLKGTMSGATREVGLGCSVGREQGRFLYDLIMTRRPEKTLETGLAWGGSAIHILCALRDSNSINKHEAIDPYAISMWEGVALKEIEKYELSSLFELIEDRSDIVLPSKFSKKEKYDFIFIDGDHSFDGSFVDAYYASKLLNIGGVMVFDDSQSKPISKAIDYLNSNFNFLNNLGYHDGRFLTFEKINEDMREWGYYVEW
jgi:predicted O-methyltransferase YrrM